MTVSFLSLKYCSTQELPSTFPVVYLGCHCLNFTGCDPWLWSESKSLFPRFPRGLWFPPHSYGFVFSITSPFGVEQHRSPGLENVSYHFDDCLIYSFLHQTSRKTCSFLLYHQGFWLLFKSCLPPPPISIISSFNYNIIFPPMLYLDFNEGNKKIIKTIKKPSHYEIRNTQGIHEFSSGIKIVEYVLAPKHKIGRVVLITRCTITTRLFSCLRTRNLERV